MIDPTNLEVGQIVLVDMSKMVGFESHIAEGNDGHAKAFVKITFLEEAREQGVQGGYGTFFTENALSGIETFFSYESVAV
jgi:hypothetical protein